MLSWLHFDRNINGVRVRGATSKKHRKGMPWAPDGAGVFGIIHPSNSEEEDSISHLALIRKY